MPFTRMAIPLHYIATDEGHVGQTKAGTPRYEASLMADILQRAFMSTVVVLELGAADPQVLFGQGPGPKEGP